MRFGGSTGLRLTKKNCLSFAFTPPAGVEMTPLTDQPVCSPPKATASVLDTTASPKTAAMAERQPRAAPDVDMRTALQALPWTFSATTCIRTLGLLMAYACMERKAAATCALALR